MRTTRGAASEAGFTLIESMIAMLFLAYIVGQMAMLTVYASRNTNLSQRVTRANALADEAIEKSRNSAFDNLQLPLAGLGETCVMAVNVGTCTATLDGGRYTRERRVSPWTIDYTTNVYTSSPIASSNQADVDVTVSFVDARGNPQAIRVVSIVSRY